MLSSVLEDPEAALTVLAPVDSAFAIIPQEDLAALLANEPALVEVRLLNSCFLRFAVG